MTSVLPIGGKASRCADAKGRPVPDGFAVVKGSKMAASVVNSMSGSLVSLRTRLIEAGVISQDYILMEDCVFTSPSLAAAIVMGRNANGQIEWKNDAGKTFREIESAALETH